MTKLIIIFRNFAKASKKRRSVIEAEGASRMHGEKTLFCCWGNLKKIGHWKGNIMMDVPGIKYRA